MWGWGGWGGGGAEEEEATPSTAARAERVTPLPRPAPPAPTPPVVRVEEEGAPVESAAWWLRRGLPGEDADPEAGEGLVLALVEQVRGSGEPRGIVLAIAEGLDAAVGVSLEGVSWGETMRALRGLVRPYPVAGAWLEATLGEVWTDEDVGSAATLWWRAVDAWPAPPSSAGAVGRLRVLGE